MKVKLNGEVIEVKQGTRIIDLVRDPKVLAALINGKLRDLSIVINQDCEVELIDFSSEQGKKIYWHSSSHVMAMAVKELFPDTKLAIGPAIDQGFYYDFDPKKPFTPEDLAKIEKKVNEITKQNLPFERTVMEKEQAIEFLKQRGEIYKIELVKELPDQEITFYKSGDFTDLCLGPHAPKTGAIGSVRLLSLAGAYWRGDEKQPMLSRIYGISFPTDTELTDYLNKIEEAKKRDHRRLGTELELYSIFEEAGAGLVFWHPKGTIIKRVIENYWVKEHLAAGYQIVSTPHIARGLLWQVSGHYGFYRDKMFTIPIENEEYVLKPMNCPGHILIYKSRIHSYRELPIRLAELGTVYRYELSGTLHGLLRVRGFTQDDAHIFCQPEQIREELYKVLQLAIKILRTLGFERFNIDLSVRDPQNKDKYLGNDEAWDMAEQGLISALEKSGLSYKRREGEAVFYGPKIDIKLLDALGREWQATTIQFDFNLPARFDITYMDRDGMHKEVVVIHHAIYGSLERFMGCLIEHYAGAFPLWLTPVQVVVMPITNKEDDYAGQVYQKCLASGMRSEINTKSEKINHRIREAELQKSPYILVVGKKEIENQTVALRKRGQGNLGAIKLEEFFDMIKKELGGEN